MTDDKPLNWSESDKTIQTTELYEHDKMNLQGFVWKKIFEYLSEKISALVTLRSKVPIWPVSVVVGKTTMNDSALFVSCTQFWQLTRGSGDCAGEMAGNAAQDEVYILWSVHFGIMRRAWWSWRTNMATDVCDLETLKTVYPLAYVLVWWKIV